MQTFNLLPAGSSRAVLFVIYGTKLCSSRDERSRLIYKCTTGEPFEVGVTAQGSPRQSLTQRGYLRSLSCARWDMSQYLQHFASLMRRQTINVGVFDVVEDRPGRLDEVRIDRGGKVLAGCWSNVHPNFRL